MTAYAPDLTTLALRLERSADRLDSWRSRCAAL
jgi:hypothetical protein